MVNIRLYLLLPSGDYARRRAAGLTLESLRQEFDAGGTWLSTAAFDPVAWGWWQERVDGKIVPGKPPVLDGHIMVWVDRAAGTGVGDPLSLDREKVSAVDRATRVFKNYYYGDIAESKIYFFCQEVAVHERDGGKKLPVASAGQ